MVARGSLRETEFLFLRRSRRLRTSDFWLVSTNLSNQHHRITRRALQFNFLLSSTNTDLRDMSRFKYHYKNLAPQLCMNQGTDRRRSFLGERCGANLRTIITSARPTLRVFRDARREFFFLLAMLTNQLGGKRFMSSVDTAQAWCHFVNYR